MADAARCDHDGCPMVIGVICECGRLQGLAPQTMKTFGWHRCVGGCACPFHADDFTDAIPPPFTECRHCLTDAASYFRRLRRSERRLRAFIAHQDIARERVIHNDDVMHTLRARQSFRVESVPNHFNADDEDTQTLRAPILQPGHDTVVTYHDGKQIIVERQGEHRDHSGFVTFLLHRQP